MKSHSTPCRVLFFECKTAHKKTIRYTHEIRSINLNFSTVAFSIKQFIMNRLHSFTLENWQSDISRNISCAIHFFAVFALASLANLPLDLLSAGSKRPSVSCLIHIPYTTSYTQYRTFNEICTFSEQSNFF